MSLLARIAELGNNPAGTGAVTNWITCRDGFRFSVLAGGGVHSAPRYLPEKRPSGFRFEAVEVGFPTGRPEPWSDWSGRRERPDLDPTDSIYIHVPVAQVQALIDLHGGER